MPENEKLNLQDGTALSLDLLGTCYTDQLRPPTLKALHVVQWLSQTRHKLATESVVQGPVSADALVAAASSQLSALGEASDFSLGAAGSNTFNADTQLESTAPIGESLSFGLDHSACKQKTVNM